MKWQRSRGDDAAGARPERDAGGHRGDRIAGAVGGRSVSGDRGAARGHRQGRAVLGAVRADRSSVGVAVGAGAGDDLPVPGGSAGSGGGPAGGRAVGLEVRAAPAAGIRRVRLLVLELLSTSVARARAESGAVRRDPGAGASVGLLEEARQAADRFAGGGGRGPRVESTGADAGGGAAGAAGAPGGRRGLDRSDGAGRVPDAVPGAAVGLSAEPDRAAG